MSDWSTEQLKEFFQARADEQDRRLGNVEQKVDSIVTKVDKIVEGLSTIGVQTRTMWGGIGAIGLVIIGILIKMIFGDNNG